MMRGFFYARWPRSIKHTLKHKINYRSEKFTQKAPDNAL